MAGRHPLPAVIGMILGRWLEHFGPDFLFVRGDHYVPLKPVGQGEFGWYMLPLMLAGLVVLAMRVRSSRSARVLLAMLIAYPAGDVISRYDGAHALRSAPGVAALVLLGAWGAVGIRDALRRRGLQLARLATVVVLIVMLGFDGRFLYRFYGEWSRDPYTYYNYQADLVEAVRRVTPRLEHVDAVFCTVAGLNEPWSIFLVESGHDPRLWFAEPRDRRAREYDIFVRYGRMYFLYEDLWRPYLRRLTDDGKPERVLFIVRPGELGLQQPLDIVRGPGAETRSGYSSARCEPAASVDRPRASTAIGERDVLAVQLVARTVRRRTRVGHSGEPLLSRLEREPGLPCARDLALQALEVSRDRARGARLTASPVRAIEP